MHPGRQLAHGVGVVTGDLEIVDRGRREDNLGRDDGEGARRAT